jgi:hypothetical protein
MTDSSSAGVLSRPYRPGKATNIAAAATTVVKSGPGILKKIIVNAATASGVITIYDNTAASGTKIATITHPGTLLQNQYELEFECECATGITVVTSGNDNVTVVWL